MRSLYSHLTGSLALLGLLASAALPARADDVSGSYNCKSGTGKKFTVQLIENFPKLTGQYIFTDGIIGHLTGTISEDLVVHYTWSEKFGEGTNAKNDGGWGIMTFPNKGMNADWGRAADQESVGSWHCSDAS